MLPALPKFYLPHTQFADNRNWKLYQVVAAEGPLPGLGNLIRREVARLDPALAVFDMRSLEEVAAAGISQQRFATVLMGIFSGCALIPGRRGPLRCPLERRLVAAARNRNSHGAGGQQQAGALDGNPPGGPSRGRR